MTHKFVEELAIVGQNNELVFNTYMSLQRMLNSSRHGPHFAKSIVHSISLKEDFFVFWFKFY